MQKVTLNLDLYPNLDYSIRFLKSYPIGFTAVLRPKPVVLFTIVHAPPGYSISGGKFLLAYPTNTCNSTADGIVKFCQMNLSNILDRNGVYFEPRVYPPNELDKYTSIHHEFCSRNVNVPWTDKSNYNKYIARLRLCCSFFNVKLTGCVDLSFKDFIHAT